MMKKQLLNNYIMNYRKIKVNFLLENLKIKQQNYQFLNKQLILVNLKKNFKNLEMEK